jgi:hypothetical protein
MIGCQRGSTLGKPNPARNVTEWITPLCSYRGWCGIVRLNPLFEVR